MLLLVFAHRAEAQTFLKIGNYKSVDTRAVDLFKSEDSYLLICGEGTLSALEKLSATLGILKDQITKVLNFGVAGSLAKSVEIDEIYEIRTCYAELGNQIEFKSFSTKNESLLDCISASKRVMDLEYAQHLSCFAHIVDRECWGLARASANFGIPYHSFKLISDMALENNLDSPICEIVKSKSEYYSDRLWKYFQDTVFSETIKQELLIDSYNEFYFTVSQYRQYCSTLKGLLSKYESEKLILDRIRVDQIKTLEMLPKQRSQIVIEKMRELLTPFNTILNSKIESVLSPLKTAKVQVKLSKNLEKMNFNINASVNNENELIQISRALQKFDYKSYQQIMNGEFDV